ncbi:MAG: class I SAM-dependent methyltransferase [Gammaproteobacteria bacterium]
MSLDRFNHSYYRRFYFDRSTAVTSRAEMRARARLIGAYVELIGCRVGSILDAGCGIGLLRGTLTRTLPRASYTGLEVSDYLCERYGWTKGSISTFAPRRTFDLVVCYDVFQYLGTRDAARGLANLGRLCRGVLYFTALTKRDWRENCDQRYTDADVYLREAEWYRQRLLKKFRPIGAGFWIRRGAPLVTWDLERS